MAAMTTNQLTPGAVPAWTAADRVRKARDYAGLQQEELAAATGLSRGALSKIEHGRTTPRRATLIAIAFACGVDVNWLKDGETPTEPEGPGGGALCANRDSNPEPADYARAAAHLSAA